MTLIVIKLCQTKSWQLMRVESNNLEIDMATAIYPGAAGNTAKTEAATFIPEIWSDEIIAPTKRT